MKTPISVAATRLRAILAAAETSPEAAPPQIASLPYANGRMVALRTDLSELAGIAPVRVGQIITERSVACYPPRWVDVADFIRALCEVRQYTLQNITIQEPVESDLQTGGIEL